MKILVDSVAGDGLGIALALQREGHAVVMAIQEPLSQRVGDGLVAKVDDPLPFAQEKADLVVVDMVGRGSIADTLVDDGVPVLAAGRFQDELELYRLTAMDTFRAAGLRVPPYEAFPDGDLERAIRFVERRADRWVFKPSGNLGTDKTFLAEDAEDMVDYLDHLGQEVPAEGDRVPPFMLQLFVKGAEVSTERWYAQGRPIPALDNCTLEEKKFLAGNLGPAVGCAGNIVLPPDPVLVRGTVAHLDRLAAEHEVSGPIDLNAIVAEHDRQPYILEATPRFGYDAIQAWLSMWKMPIGETFQALAEGEEPDVDLMTGVVAAIRVSVPPYPGGDAKAARGCPIVDDILDRGDYWPLDVMLDPDDRLVITGSDATAYVVVSRGPTIADAYWLAYQHLTKSRLPDRQYRVDLAECAQKRFTQLRSWGFFRQAGRLAA
jgi:phosphoribosylamine-glycine ligase